MPNKGTYLIVNKRGLQVGKPSSVPVLELWEGERVSYQSDLINYTTDKGQKSNLHIHRGNCTAEINIDDGIYNFTVVGDDPKTVNYLIHSIRHKFGAEDISLSIVRCLPEWKSFSERFKYLFGWLLYGNEKKEKEQKLPWLIRFKLADGFPLSRKEKIIKDNYDSLTK